MKKIILTVLTVMLAFGSIVNAGTIKTTTKANCCNGGSCCSSTSSCCVGK